MVVDDLNPDSTGYEYFKQARTMMVYVRTYVHSEIKVVLKPEPFYLKTRKNKRDNFKLK